MARFNKRPSGLLVPTPIVSTASATARTGNNAPGFVRDTLSELFLLGCNNMVGKDTFYEKGKIRDERFVALVRKAAVEDPDWTMRFVAWLRNEAHMRTAPLIAAVEASLAMVEAKIPGSRKMIYFMLSRADEPGEMISYLWSRYGRKTQIPKPIKRGIADAVQGFYTEFFTLKYDTDSHAVRFGDVLELCHPRPRDPAQETLFKYLIDRRHKRDGVPSSLTMIHRNRWLREKVAQGRTELLVNDRVLKEAGFTWQDTLSLGGSKLSKKDMWEAIIPAMGYEALLKNLRNFDEAGVSDEMAQKVIDKLTNPNAVERSRQLPMRFLSAYRHAPSLRWSYPLEKALQLSLSGVPVLPGRTLILVDQSPSMFPGYHFSTPNSSDISLADQAKIFGTALALRAEHADLVQYGGTSEAVRYTKAEPLLRIIERFKMIDSTDTAGTIRRHWSNNYDRVIVLTDEQANRHGYVDVFASVPSNKTAITFNFAGYTVGHAASGSANRIVIGGLADQAFKLLPSLEGRAAGQWPF
jgi:TROVE domain-containing protein